MRSRHKRSNSSLPTITEAAEHTNRHKTPKHTFGRTDFFDKSSDSHFKQKSRDEANSEKAIMVSDDSARHCVQSHSGVSVRSVSALSANDDNII